MKKRTNDDTTVPPITGSFEDAVRALLKTPPAPKNLGRPKAKARKRAQENPVSSTGKRKAGKRR